MSVEKYLQHYAEGEIELTNVIARQWQYVICIPAFDEAQYLPALLNRLCAEKNILIILVLNSPESASSSESMQRTRNFAEKLKQQYSLQQDFNDSFSLLKLNSYASHLLLVERYSIPDKKGVGLARKLACDIACKLIHDNKILSPWIFNTDADVSIPENYFSVSQQLNKNIAAALFAFKHKESSQSKFQLSLKLYEYSLHYYVSALKWAGSPYAFHTIGSTLILNHKTYALARGFPKRAAGEDFYLLNKLAKIGKIQSLTAPVMTLSGRSSSRAPFGTGPAIIKISELQHPEKEYFYYHPYCFAYLKNWLSLIPALWQSGDFKDLDTDPLLKDCLIELGVEAAVSHARKHSKNQESFVKHLHNWFDAFKTLKLIHNLRNLKLASINLDHLQNFKNEFPFINKAEQKFKISNNSSIMK